jgi:hypothetical protein
MHRELRADARYRIPKMRMLASRWHKRCTEINEDSARPRWQLDEQATSINDQCERGVTRRRDLGK